MEWVNLIIYTAIFTITPLSSLQYDMNCENCIIKTEFQIVTQIMNTIFWSKISFFIVYMGQNQYCQVLCSAKYLNDLAS